MSLPAAASVASSVAQSTSLAIPSLIPFNNEVLDSTVQKVLEFCRDHRMERSMGTAHMTFHYQLPLSSEASPDGVRKVSITTFNSDNNRTLGSINGLAFTNGSPISERWVFQTKDREETYNTPCLKKLMPEFYEQLYTAFQDQMSGAEFEREFHNADFLPSVPKEQWDQWEQLMPAEVNRYNTIIYPEIISAIKKISTLNPGKKLDLIDIGGGSGSLAVKILETLPNEVNQVTVVDNSKKLLGQAAEKGKKFPNRLVIKQIDLSKDSLNSSAFKGRADVIILCGVIAQQVLSKTAAKTVMAVCLPILRSNGFIIAASYSPGLLSSKDFQTWGLKVHNMTITRGMGADPTAKPYGVNEFYILQKVGATSA